MGSDWWKDGNEEGGETEKCSLMILCFMFYFSSPGLIEMKGISGDISIDALRRDTILRKIAISDKVEQSIVDSVEISRSWEILSIKSDNQEGIRSSMDDNAIF